MPARKVVIVGGGLAGMTVALELAKHGAKHGWQIELRDADNHLGGKASARFIKRGETPHPDPGEDDYQAPTETEPEPSTPDGFWEDHGFHIFPAWYANTRRLLHEIGCHKNLVDLHGFNYLFHGQFPNFVDLREFSPQNIVHNLLAPLLPWPDLILSYYFLLDLAAEPFSSRAFLDRVSASGFLRSRFYATESIALQHHQNALQGSAIPYYEVSAKTIQKLIRAWLRTPSPFSSILNGNLQEKFIKPFAERLTKLKVDIQMNWNAVQVEMAGDRVSAVLFRNPWKNKPDELDRVEGDIFVLATPPARTLTLLDDPIFRIEQRRYSSQDDRRGLADLALLRSAPMAALHVHLKRRIPNIPKEHVSLGRSRYGITFIDVSQHWEGIETTTLNCIASNFEPLLKLPQKKAKQYLVEEIREFIPAIDDDDVDVENGCVLQTHVNQPLFLNTIGAWHFRPDSRQGTGIRNLFVAGDYCRSDADLTTMESAIASALDASRAILDREGIPSKVEPLMVPEYPAVLLQLMKYAALPWMAPLGVYVRVRDKLHELATQLGQTLGGSGGSEQ